MALSQEDAERIVDAILVDMQDRRGLGHEWFQIEADIRDEIREAWIQAAIDAVGEVD